MKGERQVISNRKHSTRAADRHPNRTKWVPCGHCHNGTLFMGAPGLMTTTEVVCEYCRGTGRRKAAR